MRPAEPSCRVLSSAVAFGNVAPAPAMYCSVVLRIHRRVARAVSVAYEGPEVQPVIVRNFTPSLPGLMQRDNIVETLASGVRQQMRFL